ncbi:MAG: hypothetical protein ACJ8DQ_13100 [Xanthobacteraceae bacterium]|jgi:hypothetical protein
MNWLLLSEVVRNFGLVFVALIGIYLAWRRVSASTQQADASLQQAELARRDHVAELFNRAVGQLTHEKLEVRLGAIYTLRQIARDFPDLAGPTYELLSAYLRESAGSYGDSDPPIDVREIMSTLRDRLGKP